MLALAGAAAASPEDVTVPARNYFVRDTTGRIAHTTLNELDRIARQVNESGTGQLGVAVVPTTEGLVPREYATRLFNHWGVGHPGADDGILLFVALSDRKAEIILGTGLERTRRVTSADTDRVMRDQVVRNFKLGHPDDALIDGARALAELLARPAPSVSTPVATPVAPVVSPAATQRLVAMMSGGALPDRSPRSWWVELTDAPPHPGLRQALEQVGNAAYLDGKVAFFTVWYDSENSDADGVCRAAHGGLLIHHDKLVVLCLNHLTHSFATVVDGVDTTAPKFTQAVTQVSAAVDADDPARLGEAAQVLVGYAQHGLPPRTTEEVFDDVYGHHKAPFWGGFGVMGLFGAFGLRRWNRYRSRTCQHCGRPRQLLGPNAELKHLSEAQQREQEVGSVDYDVWWCGVCHDVWVNDNVAWFSGYSRCPNCSSRTRQSSTTTLEYATEWSTGLVEVKEWCAACNYQNRYTRVTSRLSSSSSDSSWSSSSSSSSSSFTSFGGGGSSGGGSSGSW